MGSCSGKNRKKPEVQVIQTEGQPLKRNEIHQMTRKNFKQKAPVFDKRLPNRETDEAVTAKIFDKKKSEQDLKLINSSLSRHFIFNSLSEQQRGLIIERLKFYEIEPAQVIFEQNTKGSSYFIIASGRVEVLINNERKNTLKSGDSFGEMALLHDTPRSATIRTLVRCTLWSVDRQTFRSTLEEMNKKNYSENLAFINSVNVFERLTEKQKEDLVVSLNLQKFPNGSRVVNEGDSGDLFYIIKEGSVVCSQRGKDLRTLGKGSYFGEQSLYYGSTRTASVVAAEDVTLLALGQQSLKECLGDNLPLIIYRNSIQIAFSKNELMKKLSKDQQESLFNEMQIQSFSERSVVIPSGTSKKQGIYVIVKGSLLNERDSSQVYQLHDIIGDNEMIKEIDGSFDANWLAQGEVDITFISSSGFFNSIGGDYEQVTALNEAIGILKRVQLFKGLNNDQMTRLAQVLTIQDFNDGETIVGQNKPGENFYLVKSGKVDIIKDSQVLRSITKNDYFGERSLLFDEVRTASVVARKKVQCWVMTKRDFISILNENIRKQLMHRIDLQDDKILLSDLIIVKTLGNGMFGNVFLVVHKEKRTVYALKAVDRRKISAYEIEENIVLERKILLQLDHSLIVKLVRTFKDSKRLYFLMEYIRGLDLFDVLRKLQLLKECDARFYFGCITNIVEHLHEREILFRDLKPENIVIDSVGYPKLIDFGTAKFLRGRTYTIVGTPHYMAPEVVTGHGYGLPADYWTMGIMLFEFMFGYVPFGEDESDPYSIYERVIERRLVFPQWVDNKNKVKEFVGQLLSKNPASRLGGSFEKFKSNAWFIGLNWDKINTKELKAPYVPSLGSIDLEVEAAIASGKNLEEFIMKIENSEEIPKTKRKSQPPAGWDEDF
jgi:cGMP-dependent protein kinase